MQVTAAGQQLLIRTATPADISVVRTLAGRAYDGMRRLWTAPLTQDTYDALARTGADLTAIARPTRAAYHIDRLPSRAFLVVYTPNRPADMAACKALPDFRSWLPTESAWAARATPANAEHLRASFPKATWTPEAEAMIENALGELLADGGPPPLHIEPPKVIAGDYPHKTTPFAHQATAFERSRDAVAFGLFMEQGTGKTKVLVDTAAWLHLRAKIDGLLILCPNSVKSSSAEEVATHLPDCVSRVVGIYSAAAPAARRRELEEWAGTKPSGGQLHVLVMNIEALSTDRGLAVAKAFLASRRCLMAIDESSRIKTPSAKRTKAAIKLGKLAAYRRILSGTPVTQGPLDLYAQARFLDEAILGFSSFYAFRNRYAILGGWNAREVIGYANLDELTAKLAPHTFRVTKAECLDLPEKVYQRLEVDLTAEQRRLYNGMRDAMTVDIVEQLETLKLDRELSLAEVIEGAGGPGVPRATVNIVLTQMMRLQQIVGGFITADPTEEDPHPKPLPIDGGNPKLDALLELIEDLPGKAIVWARFKPELALIASALRKRYGDHAVAELHGAISEDRRTAGRLAFQDTSSNCRFLVGQPAAGGIGITLTAATTVVYFSNDFNLETRLQSEDRAHRIGQRNTVTYIDLIAPGTVDVKLLRALRAKKSLADTITGDDPREWLK